MPEHSEAPNRWAKPRATSSREAFQDQAKASKVLVTRLAAPRRAAGNHPGKPEPGNATAAYVFAPPPCVPAPCEPATSAIVPMRTKRGAFHTRPVGAGFCCDLVMERSVKEFIDS